MSGYYAIGDGKNGPWSKVGVWVEEGEPPSRPKDQTCLCDHIGCDCCTTGNHIGSYDVTPDAFGRPRRVNMPDYALFNPQAPHGVHEWELTQDKIRKCKQCGVRWVECLEPCGPFKGGFIGSTAI